MGNGASASSVTASSVADHAQEHQWKSYLTLLEGSTDESLHGLSLDLLQGRSSDHLHITLAEVCGARCDDVERTALLQQNLINSLRSRKFLISWVLRGTARYAL